MNPIIVPRTTSLCLVFATLVASGPAGAATTLATTVSNAAGICQSALPVFDGLIRKRPLAIQNEGTSAAFVTCPMTMTFTIHYPSTVVVYARSNDNVVHDVSCTGVAGFAGGLTQAVTKSVTVPANGTRTPLVWVGTDFAGSSGNIPSALLSLSCLLPPGAGLNDTYVDFQQYIGT